MRRMNSTALIRKPAVLSAALLAACGGGGGGSLSSTNLSSAPGDAALTSYLQAPHQNTLSATDSGGNSYVLQTSLTPNAGTVSFNGHAGLLSSAAVVSLAKNGVTVAGPSSTTNYYTLSPYTPYGNVGSSGSPYAVVSSSVAIPATIKVNDSGTLDDVTFYHDSTKTVVDGMAVETYTVSARDASTLLMCLTTVTSGVTGQGSADGLGDGTESDCYTVDAAGNAALISIAVTVGSVTLTFK